MNYIFLYYYIACTSNFFEDRIYVNVSFSCKMDRLVNGRDCFDKDDRGLYKRGAVTYNG
jgi:hypothetical protein